MHELSIFVDESGDFGKYAKHSPYYAVTMVFHDQDADISKQIERKLSREGETDFLTMNPDLMKEWNFVKNKGVDPSTLTFQTTKKVWWKCKKGHEWRTSAYDRRKGSGCPVCANEINRHTIIPGKNDLESNYPDLVEE